MRSSLSVMVAVAGLFSLGTPAGAVQINTGSSGGAYDASFCPALAGQLKLAQFDASCTSSAGTRENIKRVLADPRQLGYGQLDAYAYESNQLKMAASLTVVRQDDVRECLFAVTRNPQITNWGELAANAQRVRFILPPPDSGSASTFRLLSSIDPAGIGKAQQVRNAASIEDAIQEGLSADDTVSLFVQFADPDSDAFTKVKELGGHVVPVIDRAILRQESGGRKIYFAQEIQIESAQWTKPGRKIVTACTPLVLFTGSPDKVGGEKAGKDHEDMIRTISALNSSALLPEEGLFSRLLKRTKELSATSTEKLLEATEQARENAKPYTDKAMDAAKETAEQARQAAERAGEAAKPYVDKTKEAAQKAYDDAMKMAKDLLDKKSEPPPKNN